MSGGRHNYIEFKLEEFACSLKERGFDGMTARHACLRRALIDHVWALSKAAHAVECCDSQDGSMEESEAALVAFYDGIAGSSAESTAKSVALDCLVAALEDCRELRGKKP